MKNSLFLVGDFRGITGPAIANKNLYNNLKEYLPYEVFFSRETKSISRFWEIVRGVIQSRYIFICSKSKWNYLVVLVSKLLRRKTAYLMHGYASLEYKINEKQFDENKYLSIKKYEKYMLKKADTVVCVSKFFSERLKADYHEYKDKITYCYNSVENKQNDFLKIPSEKIKIVSFGGSVKIKNNLKVCEALELIWKDGYEFEYYVVGSFDDEKVRYEKYPFVKLISQIDYSKLDDFLMDKDIYVQNSIFESFCLAIFDALRCRLSVLASKNIGAWDVIEDAKGIDVILDTDNVSEIKDKILYLIEDNNGDRLYRAINWNAVSGKGQASTIASIIKNRLM